MGTIVIFDVGAKDGIEGVLMEELPALRDWLENDLTGPGDWISDVTILRRAEAVIKSGASALIADDREAARQVDALVSAFVGDYREFGPGKVRRELATDVMLNVRRFEACRRFLERHTSPAVSNWWRLMLVGRPVGRDATRFPFQPDTPGGSIVSFATADEVSMLLSELEPLAAHCTTEDTEAALEVAIEALRNGRRRQTGLIVQIVS